MNAPSDTGRLVKELNSRVPDSIKVVLSAHGLFRVQERLLHNNYELTQRDVVEKLRVLKRGRISKDPNIADHYNLVFDEVPGCLFALKRLSEDTFVLKTVKMEVASLMPRQTRQFYVNVSFEPETVSSNP